MKCTSSIALLILLILPLIGVIVLLTLPIDILADTSNTTVIQVNISSVAALSVTPVSVSWSQVTPGGNGSVQTITVKNTGSTNFNTGIGVSVDSWVNTTNNPTAGSDPTKYMAGSFLVITNSTYEPSDTWWFMNQMSWNESNTFLSSPPTSATTGAVSWGYYWNMSNYWLWELKNGSDGTCRNSTGASLKIQPTQGLISLGSATSLGFVTNTTQWSTWNYTSGSGPLISYCIAASQDCKYLMIYKHDMNSSLPTCYVKSHIAPGSLTPGQSKTFDINPHVPTGVPAGTVTNSTVTFTAYS
jgi:hypothetical protein